MRFPPDRFQNDLWFRLCTNCGHWKPHSQFSYYTSTYGKRYLRRQCKLCSNARYRRPTSVHLRAQGLVPIARIEPYLNYLIDVCGMKATTREVGITYVVLLRWQRRLSTPEGKLQTRIRAEGALRVVEAFLRVKEQVRLGHRTPQTHYRRPDSCTACGTDLSNYTDGCKRCWERRQKREIRAA